MRNIVFLNLIKSNSYSQKPLPGHGTISQMVLDFTFSLPDVEKIIPIALDHEQGQSFYDSNNHPEIVSLEVDRQDLLLKTMAEYSEGYDHCFYYFSDTPLLDITLFEKMYSNHLKYYADYTFADGYPLGLAPEIICSRTLTELNRNIPEKKDKIDREALFSWVQQDINSFDIETEISPVDLRLKRICLSSDNKINFLQLNSFVKAGIYTSRDFIEKHESLEQHCRRAPNYYQVQISSACPQSCAYCPYPVMNPDHRHDDREMSVEKILALSEKIESFTPDARVSLSLWGEPSLHSDIKLVLQSLLEKTRLNFVIESSGIGWGDMNNPELLKIIQSQRIEWIISLDVLDSDLYQELRGEGQKEALSMIETLLSQNPDHTWVQAVRMKENEDDLEDFYRYWKQKTEHVIIQKYDHFSKELPEKKITDLSPLRRFPCWHLKREMTILLDGSVILCREELKPSKNRLNCFNESLEEIWNRGNDVFSEHINGEFKGVCTSCDEYYSYNF
ncbi:spiro-SPASM protein [Oceanispirochaeta sp.]|jgi:spiro-SPASM protein|uniref:spiro-SPASM protein n=1 Tax=Oceanispirochaeta sp. TaxID=2035350 RepID=UPI00262A044B|nr:spiro-SPASM protein [Oceanispirochaeta sp.]MDA3956987.1 spiro-SPASM protein [Oceanispirochaeta sp.]